MALLCASGCRDRSQEETVGPPSPDCALAGLDRSAVPFVLETSEGTVRCTLDADRAPQAAAMVVGLAEGRAPFRDPASGEVVRRPYYEKMPVFRAIAGGLVQTGCPVGNGTGHPGYRMPVEADPGDGARLAQPGALFLARYTPPPGRVDPAPPPAGDVIGTQLVVGLTDMSHLAGKVTVLGACADLDVVRTIAGRVANKERRVELWRARVERGSGAAPREACPARPR
jgi:cyclophilin family peptidyl-prolyl cis-trans isomerase